MINEKLSILSELIKLARIDSEITTLELEFIEKIAEMIGLEKDHVKALIGERIEFKPQASEFDRILQFHRLVLLANIDLEVDEIELKALRKAGMKLGLRHEAVESVLKEMKLHPNGMVPSDIMMKIFMTFHN